MDSRAPVREDRQDAVGQDPGTRFGRIVTCARTAGDRPGAPLPMVEGDQLGNVEQVRFREERIGAEPLGQPLAPHGRRPAEVTDESAAEGGKRVGAIALDRCERLAQRFQRLPGQRREAGQRVEASAADGQPRRRLAPAAAVASSAHAHVTVAAERALEEEGVAAGRLLLVEEAEDAEWRQQITGQLDGGRAAPKDGSGAGSSWRAL